MRVESVVISGITAHDRMRETDPKKVNSLAGSIKQIGLLQPIHLHTPDDGHTVRLVAGLHRLEAVKSLGWESIDAILFEGDSIDCRMAEIAENLHRSELTKAERAEQVAMWIQLTEEKQEAERQAAKADADQSGQVVRNESKREDGKGHRPEGGVAAAARELNVPGKTPEAKRKNASRAIKIASMTPEAKKAAKAKGLDDNQKALERIARKPESEQVAEAAKIRKEIDERKRKRDADRKKDEEQKRLDQIEKEFSSLVKAWAKARPAVRKRFRDHIGGGDATDID